MENTLDLCIYIYSVGELICLSLLSPFLGKSFQQQRETLKKTITDRSREHQGKQKMLKHTLCGKKIQDIICKHFASTLTHIKIEFVLSRWL